MLNTANKVFNPEKKNKMKLSYLEVALLQPTKSNHSAFPVILESTLACNSHDSKDTKKKEKYIKKSDAVVVCSREQNKVRRKLIPLVRVSFPPFANTH